MKTDWAAAAVLATTMGTAIFPVAIAAQNPAAPREAFEVASIRPFAPATPDGTRGGVIGGCAGGTPQIDPKRLTFTGATLYSVVVWAYGTRDAVAQNCGVYSNLNLISGGPGWIRSDQWDIQAVIPAGPPDQARLRRLVQALLEDRFKLVVRRETKNVPAYALTLGRDPSSYAASNDGPRWVTEKPARDGFPAGFTGVGQERETGTYALWARNAPVADLIPLLERLTGRPVVDRSGLTGRLSFSVWYPVFPDADGSAGGIARPLNPATAGSLLSAMRDQLGFQLQATSSPVESLIIERAERPSEN
jgi:uncharacterized protein (TIGR03435 family)